MPRTSKASPGDIPRLIIDALASKDDHYREQVRPEDYTIFHCQFGIPGSPYVKTTRKATSLPLHNDEWLRSLAEFICLELLYLTVQIVLP